MNRGRKEKEKTQIFFGLVIKREKLKAARMIIEMSLEENRGRGRPKKWGSDANKSDMRRED